MSNHPLCHDIEFSTMIIELELVSSSKKFKSSLRLKDKIVVNDSTSIES